MLSVYFVCSQRLFYRPNYYFEIYTRCWWNAKAGPTVYCWLMRRNRTSPGGSMLFRTWMDVKLKRIPFNAMCLSMPQTPVGMLLSIVKKFMVYCDFPSRTSISTKKNNLHFYYRFSHSAIFWGPKQSKLCPTNCNCCQYRSPQPLSDITQKILTDCHNLDIKLKATHLAGSLNYHADRLSRLSAYNTYNWKLLPALFRMIDDIWGSHVIGRFADYQTHQLPR